MDTMSTPVPALENKSYFEKNKKMIILLIIMLLIFCGLISYIFITNRPTAPVVNNNGNQTITPEPAPVVSVPVAATPVNNSNPSSTSNYNPTLQEGWTLEPFTECNVQVPLPPFSGAYTEDFSTYYTKWIFQKQTSSESAFNSSAVAYSAMFSKENGNQLGSDNFINSTSISCAKGELTNDEVITALGGPSFISISSADNNWGVATELVTRTSVSGETNTSYLIRKNGKTFMISPHNGATNTAEMIANNIVFN
ncbi:MAG: hypothetical protein ACMG57_03435 [Candidatus Dojkabacteria bacterium]